MMLSTDQDNTNNKRAHKFNYKKITLSKFSLLIMLVCSLTIAAIAYATFLRIEFERNKAIDNHIALNSNVAIALEQQIESVLQQIDQIATFASYAYIKDKRLFNLPDWVKNNYIIDPEFHIINVVDTNGANITANLPDGFDNYANLTGFQQVKRNKSKRLYLDKPIIGEVSGQWRLPIFKRIDNTDGSFAGAVIIAIDPNSLANFFKPINMKSRTYLEIAGTDGIIRSRSIGSNLYLNLSQPKTKWLGNILEQPSGQLIDNGADIDNQKRIMAYRTMQKYPLVITIGTSYDSAIASSQNREIQYINTAIIASLCILATSFIFIYLLRQNRKYIKEYLNTRQRMEKKLSHAAYHDSLTSLSNRTKFKKDFAKALQKAQQANNILAVLFIDVDNFKNVNDSYGHSIGDELLCQVANRLLACIRSKSQDYVSRLGGDEFGIILSNLNSAKECDLIANKILAAIRMPYQLSNNIIINASISIGSSVYPDDGQDFDTLITHADKAMYTAKNLGKNCYSPKVSPA